MYFNIGDQKRSWLIDTGASISAVRYDVIRYLQIPFQIESLYINGIGGKVESKGYVYLYLNYCSHIFKQKFYIFDSLPCKTDGILGQDFLSSYGALLDYELNTMKLLSQSGEHVSLPIEMKSESNSFLTIPSRCESIFFINTNRSDDFVLQTRELCNGVYLAGAIVRPTRGKIPVKILNTREVDVKLNKFHIETSELYDYNICTFDRPQINSARIKKLFAELKLNYLNKEEQISVENICAKYPDVFHLPGDKLTVTNLYKQNIPLKPNASPVYVKPYRIPQSQKTEIEKQIKEMLQDNIIEESRSEWSSPLLLVPKKADSTGQKRWRIVVDYRKLNQNLQDDKFPLPNITTILDSLSGAIYFTHLDLYQGFYQLDLEPSSRKYTAFVTSSNQYQMTRLPMGLKTSPNAFSRMMTIAMSGLNYEKCFVYQDDLVIFGRNLESHNQNLMDVFGRLREVNLKLNPSKCKFLQKEILYLGHVVSEKGVLPDPDKVLVLQNYPRPHNCDDVKRFVAFANYYRKFIPNFSQITAPLNNLLRKNISYEWTSNCEQAFNTLKQALINPPVLQYPDFSHENEFILQTDASGQAIGSVLCNGDGRPIAYASRGLNKAEKNYPTIEKELLAVVWSVKYFRPYLYGRRFKIQTDHRPLIYLFNMRDPSSRLLKFRLCLEEYNYSVEYIKGCHNSAADALSRLVITSEQLSEMNQKVVNVMTRAQSRLQQAKNSNDNPTSTLVDDITGGSRPDHPRVLEIFKKPKNLVELTCTSIKNIDKLHKNGFIKDRSNFFMFVPSKSIIYVNPYARSLPTRDVLVRDLGLLCKRINVEELCVVRNNNNKILLEELTLSIKESPIKNRSGPQIPRLCIIKGVQRVDDIDDRRVILNDFHLLPTSGHVGIRRMSNNIKKHYFWPSMEKDIRDFVTKCSKCQIQKYSIKTKQPMVITTTSTSAFDKVFLDIVGPINKDYSDYNYILTIQCELTKFIEAYPLRSKDAVTVARAFVEQFILRYGIPREIATDRGTEFIANTMKEVCSLLKIGRTTSTAYHHESIGALENSHKTMGAYLRIQSENYATSWSSWLPFWCFAYNNTVHTETKYTPHELVFGKVCNLPSNLSSTIQPLYNFDSYPLELKHRLQISQKDARENLLSSKFTRKHNFDKTVNPVNYNKNDLILLRNPSNDKTQPIYLGPYVVLKDLGTNVKVMINNKVETIHKNRTKMFNS